MKIEFESIIDIGDTVFHAIEENRKGVVVDISYRHRNKNIVYLVCFGINDEVWCYDSELAFNPVFN